MTEVKIREAYCKNYYSKLSKTLPNWNLLPWRFIYLYDNDSRDAEIVVKTSFLAGAA